MQDIELVPGVTGQRRHAANATLEFIMGVMETQPVCNGELVVDSYNSPCVCGGGMT